MKSPSLGWTWSVIGAVVITLLIGTEIFLIASMGSGSDLSSNGKEWKGASKFSVELEKRHYDVVSLLTTPSLLYEEEDADDTLFISLGPERAYTLTELHAIDKFESRGGKILLADDTGIGNSLSTRFEVNFIKGQLYDQNFIFNPDLVKFNVGTPFFNGFILMNRPASLTFTSGRALIASTSSAWVDRNGNGINDNITTNIGEAQGIRYLSVISDPDFRTEDTGTALFISDPSLFMNGMIEMEGNLEFAISLVEYLLPEGGKVVFDDSVHSPSGSDGVVQGGLRGIAFLTSDVNLKIVVGSIAVLSMLAIGYLYESPRKPHHDTILSRTGVAELIEPELLQTDLDELKKAVLERVRLSNGMAIEDMGKLSWDELKLLLDNKELYKFIRKGKYHGGTEKLLLEVMEWQGK